MKKLILTVLLMAAPAMAAPTLQAPIDSLSNLPIVEMHPYDETANAKAAFRTAMARATKAHKRLLVDLGGNWCGDCIALANFMRLPAIKAFVDAHYEVVTIDVGRFDRNLDIPAKFGFTERLKGVPMVLVVTPKGKLVNRDDVFATSDARHMTPQALADYLARYAQ